MQHTKSTISLRIPYLHSDCYILTFIPYDTRPTNKQQSNRRAEKMVKKSWKVFWDLQCPYSKKMWENFKEIQNRFENKYDITIYITSLAFHPQAFTAQCGASLIETMKGRDVMFKYVDACYENQDMYMNDSIGDSKMSEIDEVFVKIAEKAGVFDETFTKEKFLQDLHNWEMAVNPAYTEHKIALSYGVFGESGK
jgi:2-hydroxychromene-2-carboxylate isomerase